MITRILLAVDGSEWSNRAIPLAAELARKFGAEIVVFHAQERVMAPGGNHAVESTDDAQGMTDRVVAWLKDEEVSARGETRVCYTGHIARELAKLARTEGANIIVMGSRGLSEVGGLMLGSVVNKVLHLAEVPVLIVP